MVTIKAITKVIDMTKILSQVGNILRCFKCDSTRHLASKYWHRANQLKSSDTSEVHITLLASVPDQKQNCLIWEKRGVSDLECTTIVSWEFWIEKYSGALPKEWMKTVKISNNTSSVGNGKESKAIRNVVTPVTIGNKHYMSVDVVKNDIPLLISKLIKSLGMKLNFLNYTTYFSDRSIPLMCSTTSYYSVPLTKWDK